jgi:hypothetical protein
MYEWLIHPNGAAVKFERTTSGGSIIFRASQGARTGSTTIGGSMWLRRKM